MNWPHVISCFFGGVFFANAIPHFVSGVTGRPFQSPFAKPPGQGLSSSTVNVVWGFLNFVAAYVLVCRIGDIDWKSDVDITAFGLGMLTIALFCARHFGRFHGGNKPEAR